MRVDVVDVLRAHAGVVHGHAHRASGMLPGRIRLGDVLGVGGDAVAAELRVDLRVPLLRVLELLENDDAAGLAHDEAVALGVERTARGLGVGVAPRERAHGSEATDADLRDPGLGAAGEHDVGTAEPDVVESLADRHVGGRAGRALGPERAARPELHRDPGGAHVRDDRGDRERIDPVGAAREQLVVAVLEGLEAADSGCDGDAHALGLRLDLDPGVRLRHAGGRDDHLREAVELPRLAVLDPLGGLEVLQLAREMDGEAGGIELLDRRRAALSRGEVLPEGLGVVSERRHRADSGHDNPPASVHAHADPLPTCLGRRRRAAPRP